jgi:hypothetical protein
MKFRTQFDEIWVTSTFVFNAIKPQIQTQVVKYMPIGLLDSYFDLQDSEALQSKEITIEFLSNSYTIPADVFIFLVVVDSATNVARQNPIGAVYAFHKAFEQSIKNVRLLIIAQPNGAKNNSNYRKALRKAISDDYRIGVKVL